MSNSEKHLYSLDELSDYKISEGYPDVRGWSVKDADNRIIGKVDNLLVSTAAERVVYVDVDVDQSIIDAKYDPYSNPENPEVREFLNKEGENHIIIPIGLVDFSENQKHVLTNTVNHRTFAETKRYKKETGLDREYERHVLSSYNRPSFKANTDHHENDDEILSLSESKLRDIIREEIRSFHNNQPTDSFDDVVIDHDRSSESYSSKTQRKTQYDLDGDGDVDVEISRNDSSKSGQDKKDVIYGDEDFYERREFKNKRHKWD